LSDDVRLNRLSADFARRRAADSRR